MNPIAEKHHVEKQEELRAFFAPRTVDHVMHLNVRHSTISTAFYVLFEIAATVTGQAGYVRLNSASLVIVGDHAFVVASKQAFRKKPKIMSGHKRSQLPALGLTTTNNTPANTVRLGKYTFELDDLDAETYRAILR